MSERTSTDTRMDGMVDIGAITATESGDENTVTATVVGSAPADVDLTADHTDDPDVEQLAGCDTWGDWAILSRPLAPTTEGACEAVFVRRGDTREIIATKDRRWQIEIEEGEVVVRNLTADASTRAYVHIKANGEVIIDSPKVYVGSSGATEKIGLGTAIKGHFDAIKTFLDLVTGHTHVVSGATAAASAALAGGAPSVPDVESRHVVEN